MTGGVRPLPLVTERNRHFWEGGRDGELRLLRCACGHFIHPPSPACPICRSRQLHVEAVAGTGTVHTFTINCQQWFEDWPVPYVVAVVELDEQAGLRVTSNIVGCPERSVMIGMRVRVLFEEQCGVWFPLFAPEGAFGVAD